MKDLTVPLFQVYGDTLMENPGVAGSSFGGHRVIVDRWKGMSEEQKAEIQRIRDEQVIFNKRIKDCRVWENCIPNFQARLFFVLMEGSRV